MEDLVLGAIYHLAENDDEESKKAQKRVDEKDKAKLKEKVDGYLNKERKVEDTDDRRGETSTESTYTDETSTLTSDERSTKSTGSSETVSEERRERAGSSQKRRKSSEEVMRWDDGFEGAEEERERTMKLPERRL